MNVKTLAFAFASTLALGAFATDYYVAETGNDDNDGSAEAPYLTIDKAVVTARTAGDVIHVMPGTYETTLGIAAYGDNAKWGPNVAANVKLIGEGETRDEVTIKSHGSHRTLRMAANSWVENVTLVGELSFKADKGGVIEMSGGTLTNCVVKSGTATGNGGSIHMTSGLVVDCHISGSSGKEGGQIYMTNGTIKDCTVLANGTTTGSGGGIYMDGSGATVEDCTIDAAGVVSMAWHGGCIYMKNGTVRNTICKNGTCTNGDSREGGNIYMENGTLENVTLENGTSRKDGGNLRLAGGTINGLTCRGGTSNVGGNIYMTAGTLTNVTCEDGSAKGEGGNINMTGGSITGLVCTGGTATSNGGNIRAKGAVTISDAQISDGTIITDAEAKGCNVYMDESVKLIRAKVTGGTSWKADKTTPGFNGGSLCMWSADAVIDTCLVAGCARGGILSGTTGHVYGTTIVANGEYGYWSWNESQTLQNCVIYGNAKEYSGNQPSGSNGSCVNCAVSANSLSKDKYPTLVVVTEDDFVDYANGDYRPCETSKLVDAGADDMRAEAQVLDLAGKARLSEGIDIGCYEYQHSNMTVAFTAPALDHAYTPATATFTATAANAPGDVTFAVDFGDGTVQDFTTETISHVYTTRGTYTISVVAKSGEETSKPMTREVRVAEKVQRVGEGGFATIADAVAEALDGCEIVLAEGTYEVTEPVVLNKAVTMTGEGAVTIRNVAEAASASPDHHILTVGAGAVVSGLTFEGGQVYNRYGGNVVLDGGTLSNCTVRSGLAVVENNNDGGAAGVMVNGTSVMTHCTVTGNTVRGTAKSSNKAGGAVFVASGAKPKITNSLIADNTYVTSGETPKSGAAGIMFGGSNENAPMENCTVAGNVVEGSLSNPSAGCFCTSWSAIFRNNVFAANRETGREGASAVYIDSHNTVTYCITDTAEAVNANCFTATAEAMFRNVTGKNYQPKAKGALWNKGTTPSVKEATDLLGNPRVMFDVIDLGCYEAQSKGGFTVVIL